MLSLASTVVVTSAHNYADCIAKTEITYYVPSILYDFDFERIFSSQPIVTSFSVQWENVEL